VTQSHLDADVRDLDSGGDVVAVDRFSLTVGDGEPVCLPVALAGAMVRLQAADRVFRGVGVCRYRRRDPADAGGGRERDGLGGRRFMN